MLAGQAVNAVLTALKVLVLAGGGEPAENQHSHLVHVQRLTTLLVERGVPAADIGIFWADGADPAADRAVTDDPPAADDWLVRGTALDSATAPVAELVDTRFEVTVQPARRENLQTWLSTVGPGLRAGDTLLIAVTDHGEPDPEGLGDTRITLWGESWSTAEMLEDLAPVASDARVVLWLSQCYSGGFARLSEARENLCGAFSATADRPAYGCYPDLARRTDYGHFHRMLEALAGTAAIGPAAERVAVLDDSPDTPHLSSDAYLLRALEARATSADVEIARLVDNRLGQLDGDAPPVRQAARIAARYGLGAPKGYEDLLEQLDEIDRARYALTLWMDDWQRTLAHAIDVEIEDLTRRIGEPRGRKAKAKARARAIREIKKILASKPKVAARIQQIRARAAQAEALSDRLDQQEAAVVRIGYVLARAAANALTADQQARYAALRGCEQAAILPPPAAKAEPLTVSETLPPLRGVPGEVESLAPGYLGIGYRDRPRHEGVVVERFDPVAPGGASALAVGDEIRSVNGWRLHRRGGFREAVRLATPGSVAQLEIKRGRKNLTIPVMVAPTPLPPPTPIPGEPVPTLALTPFDRSVPLPTLGEGQPLVLFFWATWCKPCKAAVPELVKWAAKNRTPVIAITQEPAATVKRWASRNRDFPLPLALDPDGAANRLFAVDRTPVFARLDGQGRLQKLSVGYTGQLDLD